MRQIRTLSRRRLLILMAVGGGASVAAACELLPTSTSTRAPGGSAASPVVVMQAVEAASLDPQFRNAIPELNINAHVFNMCTWRDSKSLQIVPDFFQQWRMLDARTWEFTLPAGARFHDGTLADAEAVAFSLTRQANVQIGGKPTQWGSFWGRLSAFDTAEPVNSTTVRLKTRAPAPIVPDLLSSMEVVPPGQYADESAENLGKVATHPVGSGPYRLVEWVKDERLVLEAWDGYWGPKPAIKTVIFKPVPEPSTRVLALQNGEADVIVNVPPDQAGVFAVGARGRLSQVTGARNVFVGMRADHPYLADKRVRQAFNFAFNFDAVNRALLNGSGTRSRTVISPPHEPSDAQPYPYDPQKAQALLAEVGWRPGVDGVLTKDGARFEIDMISPAGRYVKDKEIAQAVQQDLDRIGVKVHLNVMEWSLFVSSVLARRDPPPLYFIGLGATFSGQEELNGFHRDFSLNATHWENVEYHRLFDELQTTVDDQRRAELMAQMSRILFDDPPAIFIYHQVDYYGISSRLEWAPTATERIRMTEARLVN